VLFIRTDAIGDAVLAMDQLRLLQEQFPTARLAVACPEAVAGLYRAAPFPLQVLSYYPNRFQSSWTHRLAILRRLRAFRPTHVLNGMVTRTTVCDLLALGAGAPVRIGWAQPGVRRLRDRLLDLTYTTLFPATDGNELQRNCSFITLLGLQSEGFAPRVWWSGVDSNWAEAWRQEAGIGSEPFILLFAGAQHLRRGYMGYGAALALALSESKVPVVAVGSAQDWAENQAHLDAYPGPSFNLCGKTTLSQLVALARIATLGVGAETGISHVACAVGVPQVVLIGGGHFGRFHPYSPLTTLACLPLDCFGCDWVCRYPRAHCIHDVPAQVLAEAIRSAWQASHDRPQIYYPLERRLPEVGPHAVAPEGLPSWVQARWVAVGPSKREPGGP
jgi:ADP-heptose:LPS heptosyltransferase